MTRDETAIRSISGLLLGHDTIAGAATGCTVIVAREGAVAGVDVRGGAPGTRETDLLAPWATVERIHGLLLTGGSAFGLAAANGVVDALEEADVGVRFGGFTIPIVPAAVIFDLTFGDGRVRPDAASGRRATEAALRSSPGDPFEEGSVGAGAGATVGKACGREHAKKGGLGVACHRFPGGELVGAIAVVNALGDVFDPTTAELVAGGGGADSASRAFLDGAGDELSNLPASGESTTLVAILTDVTLGKAACTQVARMAHAGLARAIVPVHTTLDGDVVFALASCRRETDVPLAAIGHAAATVAAEAILRGVRAAV